MREYLIEVPHSPEECSGAAALPGGPIRGAPPTIYRGCGAGTHTTWIIARLVGEEEAWSLVPRLLRDTARVVVVDCPPEPATHQSSHDNRKDRQ